MVFRHPEGQSGSGRDPAGYRKGTTLQMGRRPQLAGQGRRFGEDRDTGAAPRSGAEPGDGEDTAAVPGEGRDADPGQRRSGGRGFPGPFGDLVEGSRRGGGGEASGGRSSGEAGRCHGGGSAAVSGRSVNIIPFENHEVCRNTRCGIILC